MEKPDILIISKNLPVRETLQKCMQGQFAVSHARTAADAIGIAQSKAIKCVIAYPIDDEACHLWEYGDLKRAFSLLPLIVVCTCHQHDLIVDCAENIADECLTLNNLNTLAERVRLIIDRSTFQRQLLATDLSVRRCPPRVRKGLAIVHTNFTRIKYAEDVSRQLGIAVTTFRKEFKQYLGISFTQYLIRVRLLYASYLAQNAALTGHTVSQRCGFHDEHEFYRCFRRKLGITFSEYRSDYSLDDFERLFGHANHQSF